jgi:hypothetical protein
MLSIDVNLIFLRISELEEGLKIAMHLISSLAQRR